MLTFLGIIAGVMSLVVIGTMLYGFLFKGEMLLSWRNFFLLGFFQFYTIATFWAARVEFYSEIYNPTGTGYFSLAISIPLFFAIFMACYGLAKNWTWPSRLVPRAALPVTTSSVLICALTFAGLVALSIPLVGGSYADSIIVFCRTNMASAAAALMFYLVISNWRNPLWWALFIPVFIMAVIISVVGSIDRRNFLSVFFGLAFVYYFAKLRYEKPSRVLGKMAVLGAVTFLCLIIYNSGRHKLGWSGATFGNRQNQILELAKNPDFSARNVFQELLLQDTPLNTVCLMEIVPSDIEYYPLHGAYFYIVNPIPRTIFPTKPRALGIVLQERLQVQANLGCGIIGHGWYEAGWIGIVYYAIAFGFICAIVDRLLRERGDNPFFVVAFGCSLGNVLGLPRGETSMFFDMITAGFVICLLGFTFLGYVFRPYMLVGKPIVMNPHLTDHQQDDDHAPEWHEGYEHEAAEAAAAYGELPAAGALVPARAQRDPDEP